MTTISIALIPNSMASSITLPVEMLNAADNINRASKRSSAPINIKLHAHNKEPVKTSGGLYLLPNSNFADTEKADLIIIPGLWRNPLQALNNNPEVCEWLNKTTSKETLTCAVGTGSCFLAKANLLQEKPATTHWFYGDLMKKEFPNVNWKPQHLITQHDNIYCAGSINAIADLTVHFVEKLYNASTARRVESQFSPEIRQAYQSQLFDQSDVAPHADEAIANAQTYIKQHFDTTINFSELCTDMQLAYRTFQRRFKHATGYSPLKYQQLIRIQNARELLKSSNLNIQEISEIVGYVDASHFSKVFRQMTEQTPLAYRQAVRGKLFSP